MEAERSGGRSSERKRAGGRLLRLTCLWDTGAMLVKGLMLLPGQLLQCPPAHPTPSHPIPALRHAQIQPGEKLPGPGLGVEAADGWTAQGPPRDSWADVAVLPADGAGALPQPSCSQMCLAGAWAPQGKRVWGPGRAGWALAPVCWHPQLARCCSEGADPRGAVSGAGSGSREEQWQPGRVCRGAGTCLQRHQQSCSVLLQGGAGRLRQEPYEGEHGVFSRLEAHLRC